MNSVLYKDRDIIRIKYSTCYICVANIWGVAMYVAKCGYA